ncbi:MAG: nitroreductase [Prevotellaceae bacterium]|nr:nitroreductase [Prevotellaceae bacterium]
MLTLEEAIAARHSVRRYQPRDLAPEAEEALRRRIESLNAESGLHIQLVTGEPRAFRGLASYGVFRGVRNYLVMAGPRTPYAGEAIGRNGEKLVLLAQQTGLNSCWAGLTYRSVKPAFSLAPGERVYCLIALGYGQESGRPRRSKRPEDVSDWTPAAPEWYRRGVEAALLAPTAVNQQRFRFRLLAPDAAGRPRVEVRRLFSLAGYTHIDLGIAKLHFEIGAGTDNFAWAGD